MNSLVIEMNTPKAASKQVQIKDVLSHRHLGILLPKRLECLPEEHPHTLSSKDQK